MGAELTEYEVEPGEPDFTVFQTDKYVIVVCDGDDCGILWYGRNNGSEVPYPLDLVDTHECKKK